MQSDQKCKVHGVMLRLSKVPIRYGSQVRDEDLWTARAKLFPNSKSFVLGGCSYDLDRYESEQLVCDECRKAEETWRTRNGHWD